MPVSVTVISSAPILYIDNAVTAAAMAAALPTIERVGLVGGYTWGTGMYGRTGPNAGTGMTAKPGLETMISTVVSEVQAAVLSATGGVVPDFDTVGSGEASLMGVEYQAQKGLGGYGGSFDEYQSTYAHSCLKVVLFCRACAGMVVGGHTVVGNPGRILVFPVQVAHRAILPAVASWPEVAAVEWATSAD